MTDTSGRDQYYNGSQEIALTDIARAFYDRRIPLVLFILACGALGMTVAFLMTPVYRATVVMVPANAGDESDRLRGFSPQLGNLAAFAGVGGGESAKVEEALAILKSRQFMEKFIIAHDLLPVLFEGLWDSQSKDWSVDDPEEIPTIADGILMMNGSVRSIIRDNDTRILSMHVEWKNPDQAALWANSMISMANQYLRNRAVQHAEKSLAYLNDELEKTTSIEVRGAIFRLMEGQIQNIMFANVSEEYAFSVIDPAVTPEMDNYIRPNRPLLTVLGFAAGLLLATAFALIVAIRDTRFLVAG